MNDPALIDRIVAEVVARLKSVAATSAAPALPPANGSAQPNPKQSAQPTPKQIEAAVSHSGRAVTLPEKVISRQTIRALAKDVGVVHVMPGAIITPAVLDDLKDRGIQLIRGKLATSPKRTPMIWVAVDGVAGPLAGKMKADVHEVNELTTAVAAVAAYVTSPATRGAIVTDRPAVAAAALNRQAHVRAVWIESLEQLTSAQSTLAPNALLIHDSIATSFLGINLLQQFFNTGKELPCDECQAVLDAGDS